MRVSVVLNASGGMLPRPEIGTGEALLALQSRPDQAGDRYRWLWETEGRETSARGMTVRRGREEFQIDILDVHPTGLCLARTRMSVEVSGEAAGVEANPYDRAWVGVRVLFACDRRGRPERALNWAEAREHMLDNLKRETSASGERAQVEAFMKQVPPEAARELLGAEMTALAGMRSLSPVPAGRRNLPPEPFQRQDGGQVKLIHTLDNALVETGRVRCERVSRSDDGRQLLRTTAVICTENGWPLTLESVHAESLREEGYEMVRTAKVKRL